MTRKRDALKILLQNTGGILPKFYRKIHCLTSEFHIKPHVKIRYRANHEAFSAISVFQVEFNVQFTRQVVNFS